MSSSAITEPAITTHGRVILTKVLAAICGVAYCFAIAAVGSTGQDLDKLGIVSRSGTKYTQNLVFAAVCFTVGAAAMVSAIRIRHRMGRPIFEPWQHW